MEVREKSRRVQIDEKALRRFSENLATGTIEPATWDFAYHYIDEGEQTVAYLLVVDSLNFCFWPARGKERWEIEYGPEKLSGYYGLAASIKKSVESGIPILQPDYLANLSLGELKKALVGRGELQLMEDRLGSLNELGLVLLRHFQGKATRLVEAAGNSAIRLTRLLAEYLTSFRDVSEYEGQKVFFYKRAQILAADLHGAFKGEKWGRFKDMDQLTTFADYKLPQVLRHLGVLRYTRDLAEKVDRRIFLAAGGPEEVEIRANTVCAVELIHRELERLGKDLRAFEIDWVLWNLGQQDEFRSKPYHRTVTIFY